jgi:predicted transcriptional regulator
MGLKMIHPQEVEVFYILPAIRKEFAKDFKEDGKKQSEIAKILGVTEAAVSTYVNEKKQGIKLDTDTKELIKHASKNIHDQAQFVFHSQSILDHMLKSKQTCHIHSLVNKDVAHDCNTCFECK